jgi:hypothetical protein
VTLWLDDTAKSMGESLSDRQSDASTCIARRSKLTALDSRVYEKQKEITGILTMLELESRDFRHGHFRSAGEVFAESDTPDWDFS